MTGLIVELILSWLLLWLFYKQDLGALGIVPSKAKLLNLFFGFVIAMTCCTVYYFSFSVIANYKWGLNSDFSYQKLLSGSWWTLKSVLYEELIFRGASLYILIRKIGVKSACIVSAIGFGVYHWFTAGVLGNPLQMTYIFLMTGIWGLMFAFAFARTKSLYLPIGLHFGWNLFSTMIFSQGPLGNQLLIGNGEQKLGIFFSIMVFLFQVFAVPLFTLGYLNYLTMKGKTKPAAEQQLQAIYFERRGSDKE